MTESVTLPVWLFAILLAAALWAALDRLLVPGVRWYFRSRMQTALSELEVKSAVCQLIAELEAVGAHVYVPRGDLDYAVSVGLRMLTLRHIVREEEGLYRANAEDEALLAYYANAIEPLVAAAVGKQPLAVA